MQHADIKLHALVDNVGPADITGTINPFSGTQTNEIKISVKDVDLTPTSPYARKIRRLSHRAREIKSRPWNIKIIGKKLSSKNVITLDQFTFGEKVDSPDATHLPVRLAVAIMKDRNGKIVLDVPMDGSLDDPQFRIGKVVDARHRQHSRKSRDLAFLAAWRVVRRRRRGIELSGFCAGQRGTVNRQHEET